VILNALGSQTVASKFYDDVPGIVWPGSLVRAIKQPVCSTNGLDRQQEWTLPPSSSDLRSRLPSHPVTSSWPASQPASSTT